MLIACLLLALGAPSLKADEGMWLLPYLEKLNIRDMKAKGFKLSAKDIYNLNGDAIKDAIVIFGNGCTGEIVSDRGLLLTNHHCGFDAIQSHSSVEHDYLKNGFWAMSDQEEIPTPGLTVTFIRRISDVSDRILPQLSDTLSEKDREAKVAEIVERIKKETELDNEHQEVEIQDFFGGNQYLMFVKEIFKDVRLVGAPPSSIGKFGGDTDNWMWPRHTGDFSVFRVYSDRDGQPAEYSKDNVPYAAPAHLTVSLKGYKPGSFAMIIGFPGSTERYKTSYEIDYTLGTDNPNRIFIRGERQKLMMEDMLASDEVRIQYASKYAMSSNYWKNSIGESRGLKKLKVRYTKLATEKRFTEWVNADPARKEKYAEALLASPTVEALLNDPAYKMRREVVKTYNALIDPINSFSEDFARGHRLYVAGLMEMDADRVFYPDANFTMRLTYGQVLPYEPQDAVSYNYFTTLDGVIAKEDPENAYEFSVPEKLKELYRTKDYGPYAEKGVLHVGFISNNDITGGNSGSPVMNAKGQLIGLAFDGNWEAMSGDIAFEPALQRTISVDIRYVLFIIDKYAGATRLIDEMTIVR